jgi:hypothetical protein
MKYITLHAILELGYLVIDTMVLIMKLFYIVSAPFVVLFGKGSK